MPAAAAPARAFSQSSHVVRSGGLRLHARLSQPEDPAARQRPAVVLVHGYPDDSSVWHGVRDALAGHRRVLVFDVRGAGLSDAPGTAAGYRIPQFVEDLAAVADTLLPGERFHLVGHDWGSIHSWESVTTDRLRGRIASYTSISGPCLDHVGHWIRAQLSAGTWAAQRAVWRQRLQSWYVGYFHVPLVPEWSWRLWVARAWPWWLRRTEGIRAGTQRPTLVRDACNGLRMYRANFRERLARPQARTPHAPVQLIVPTQDRYVSPAVTRAVEPWVPHYWRHEIAAGHWLPLRRPGWVAECIGRFADYVESGQENAALQQARVAGALAG
ncbi:alpha/beta fold hydrolase [Ralstonia mannitolilytica]|uniref:alpha/beta fold hydrolase n=1 Tax=Ralstonia mannitolilytica TaxID=105219 RepID=UPI000CEE20E5|nr:alpha/beta fold hydrolase [Ralstonia mannitolilytica]